MNDILNWLLEFISSIDAWLRISVAGIAIFLETSVFVGLVVPGDSIVIIASTGTNSALEFVILALVVFVCSLGGQSVGYLIGHHFGPRIKVSKLGRTIGESTWNNANNFIDRQGGWAVFVSRFLPVFHALTPVTVGMSNMTYKRFMIWASPAAFLWAVAYSGVGWIAKDTYHSLADQLHYAGFIFIGIIIAFWVTVFIVKKVLEKRTKRYMETPGDGDTTTIED